MAGHCKGRLWASRDELFDALSREQFGTTHRFVADEILQHIEPLEQRIAQLDQYLKKSIVALAHKMLRIIYAMLSNGTPYQDSSVDYEALSVARNAPRWLKMLRKHGFMAESPHA